MTPILKSTTRIYDLLAMDKKEYNQMNMQIVSSSLVLLQIHEKKKL